MGEIADMILDGFLDEETGEVIDGAAPGYVRRGRGLQEVDAETRARLPFGCPKCRKRFQFKGALRQHLRAKHAP